MDINLVGPLKVIMNNTETSHNYFGWPTVIKLQDGRIMVGASGYRIEHICPFGKAVVIFSNDEGETYTKPRAVIDTVLDDRDVGLTAFSDNGIIVTSFNNTTEFQRENMPQTQECFDYINSVSLEDEAAALGVTFKVSFDGGKTFSKMYKSPVSSPHGPTVLNDGRILWVGRVLGVRNNIEARILEPSTGETTLIGRIPLEDFDELDFYEPNAIQLPDGKIVCHLRTQNHDESIFTLYQTVSYDNAKTWSKPVQIIKSDSGAPAHLFLHSSGILICAYSHRLYPYGIRMVFSKDGGETWSDEKTLYENYCSDDIGYPATTELDDGTLLTVFYAREQEDPPDVIMQQKWRFAD